MLVVIIFFFPFYDIFPHMSSITNLLYSEYACFKRTFLRSALLQIFIQEDQLSNVSSLFAFITVSLCYWPKRAFCTDWDLQGPFFSEAYEIRFFIFQLRGYPCNITHDTYIFLSTTDTFRTKTDIPRIFLEHECIFCG